MIYKRIGDVCKSCKKSMTPISNTIYSLYSLPAFDNLKKPEVVDGSQIKSNKLAVPEDIILFNKLNPKYRRVWNIHSISVANPICSTEFIPIKAKGILQDYLYYCLISHRVTELVNAARKGTSNSQQRIDEDILFNIEIPVPSVEQQRKIAEFLCSIDHKISANNRINDNLSHRDYWPFIASSPFKSFGNNVSRIRARRLFSRAFLAISCINGRTVSSNDSTLSFDGRGTSTLKSSCWFKPGCAALAQDRV